jgi:hypothetical protein
MSDYSDWNGGQRHGAPRGLEAIQAHAPDCPICGNGEPFEYCDEGNDLLPPYLAATFRAWRRRREQAALDRIRFYGTSL